jgi:hypothetical protein
MTRVALISANLGSFVPDFGQHIHCPQEAPPGVEYTWHLFTDATYPPRACMRPMLQSRIPKTLGWTMVEDYDAYIWFDATFALAHPTSAAQLLDGLDEAALVVFRHPFRRTVAEEAAFLRQKQPVSRRLSQRYDGEDLDGLMQEVSPESRLLATGILAYRPAPSVVRAFRAWWQYITRFHHNDQLSLPWCLETEDVRVQVLDRDIYNDPAFSFTRGRRVTRV